MHLLQFGCRFIPPRFRCPGAWFPRCSVQEARGGSIKRLGCWTVIGSRHAILAGGLTRLSGVRPGRTGLAPTKAGCSKRRSLTPAQSLSGGLACTRVLLPLTSAFCGSPPLRSHWDAGAVLCRSASSLNCEPNKPRSKSPSLGHFAIAKQSVPDEG